MQLLKRIIIFITIGSIFVNLSASQNNLPTESTLYPRYDNKVEMKVEALKNKRIKIKIKNISEEVIVLTNTGIVERDYTIEVMNQDRKKLSLSEQGKKIKSTKAVLTNVVYIRLKPNEETTNELDLKTLFDFVKSEKYTVIIKREVYFKTRNVSENIEAKPLKLK